MFRLGRDIEIQETDDHMMQLGFVQFTYTAAEDHDLNVPTPLKERGVCTDYRPSLSGPELSVLNQGAENISVDWILWIS
jgi:hypothetical protein